MFAVELSVHVEPVHCDDSSGALLDETASDWEQNFASLQDFFGELVVYAEVCSFQLPAATLHLLFLLEVSEFGHNRTRPRGSRFLRSHPMDSFEADVFHGVFRKLQVCLQVL